MSDLRIDLSLMDGLYKDLLQVSMAFTEIDTVSKNVANVVGHPALAERVGDFSGTWDDRRATIIESLDAVWKAALAIHKNFKELDQEMAAELSGGGA